MAKLRTITINGNKYLYGVKKEYDAEEALRIVTFRAYLKSNKNAPMLIEFNLVDNPRIAGTYAEGEGLVNLYQPSVARKLIEYGLRNGWTPANSKSTTRFWDTVGILNEISS